MLEVSVWMRKLIVSGCEEEDGEDVVVGG